MNLTINNLMDGERDLIKYYSKALEIWENILVKDFDEETDELTDLISEKQGNFEEECGGKRLGQEIMAVVGIYQFYSPSKGFNDNINIAMSVYNSIQNSDCSREVKNIAEIAAERTDLLHKV